MYLTLKTGDDKMGKSDMAQISYISHCKQMYKQYQKRKKLKYWLIGTNILWTVGAVVTLALR